MSALDNESLMRRALKVAEGGWGTTHPNPIVGALIVENGEIVAEGFHEKAGGLHAERDALRNLGRRPKRWGYDGGDDGALFDAWKNSSLRRWHYRGWNQSRRCRRSGPESKACRQRIRYFKNAGIEVESEVLAEDCDALNPIFNFRMAKAERAFVAVKVATSDGKIAASSGDARWVSGEDYVRM